MAATLNTPVPIASAPTVSCRASCRGHCAIPTPGSRHAQGARAEVKTRWCVQKRASERHGRKRGGRSECLGQGTPQGTTQGTLCLELSGVVGLNAGSDKEGDPDNTGVLAGASPCDPVLAVTTPEAGVGVRFDPLRESGEAPGGWTTLASKQGTFLVTSDPLQDNTLLHPSHAQVSTLLSPSPPGFVDIPSERMDELAESPLESSALPGPVLVVEPCAAPLNTHLVPSARAHVPFPALALSDLGTLALPGESQSLLGGAGQDLMSTSSSGASTSPSSSSSTPHTQDTGHQDEAGAEESLRRLSVTDQALELASLPALAGLPPTHQAATTPNLSSASSSTSPSSLSSSSSSVHLEQPPSGSAESWDTRDPVEMPVMPGVAEGQGMLEWAKRKWQRSGAGGRVRSILSFAGPALGIWVCSPLMSLIDTAVVGTGSSLELAALGPGTIVVDNLSFLFMFLSTATNNLIATSYAQHKPQEASAHLQRLLMVALLCGGAMVLFSELCVESLISGLAGSNQVIVPAAVRYAKIRGLAWPAVLVTSVTQSASLALQDSWSPLRCLSIASAVNLVGDIFLCRVLDLGIGGAAWATAVSQFAACALMLFSLGRDRRLQLGVKVPSTSEMVHFVSLAGPIFVSLVGKVGFYTMVTYQASTLGTVSLAAHQVVIGIFAVCAVCAEPLSQTAQAFLPRLCVGVHRNLKEARALILTLAAVALLLGSVEALAGAGISLMSPGVFTSDPAIAHAMASVVGPLCASLVLNPLVLACEGVLLANRDVQYLAGAMMGNLTLCGGLLVLAAHLHLGLLAYWWTVVLFQVGRITAASCRILSEQGILGDSEGHSA